MSFVFISHASEDKRRIRPIIDSILAAGLKVFIDDPARAGFGGESVHGFVRLHADRAWKDQLDEAMAASACALVCWSRHADVRRRGWLDEVAQARGANKLVSCVIDDVPIRTLPAQANQQQIINLDLARRGNPATAAEWYGHMALLLEDIRRTIQAVTDGRRPSQRALQLRVKQQPAPSAEKLPWLADRRAQSEALRRAIDTASGDRRIVPVVLLAPRNELPDEFLDGMAMVGTHNPQGRLWHPLHVDWPTSTVSPEEFVERYHVNLRFNLEVSGARSDQEIATALGNHPLVLVEHVIEASEWRREEPALVLAWLRFWRRLGEGFPGLRVVLILRVNLPRARPGWQRRKPCPTGDSGGPVRLPAIWAEIQQLSAKPGDGPAPMVLPVLSPILEHDAVTWANRETKALEDSRRTAVKQATKRLYRWWWVRRRGVSHEDFCDKLRPHCAAAPSMGSSR
ncbi:MAG: toll/interleukin-1 receptor domain-containing protein [Acetobacteraceae bacterium]|nr:toll/interleukin-1 receptor domain-containing protein [Acetobacteraceae bacterium]